MEECLYLRFKNFNQFLCLYSIRAYCFLSCTSFCLSVVNLNLRYNFWIVRDRDFCLHIWHAYSTYGALSNDTKVNDLVTTLTLVAKIAFSDFVAALGIVFHKHVYFFMYVFRRRKGKCTNACKCMPIGQPLLQNLLSPAFRESGGH